VQQPTHQGLPRRGRHRSVSERESDRVVHEPTEITACPTHGGYGCHATCHDRRGACRPSRMSRMSRMSTPQHDDHNGGDRKRRPFHRDSDTDGHPCHNGSAADSRRQRENHRTSHRQINATACHRQRHQRRPDRHQQKTVSWRTRCPQQDTRTHHAHEQCDCTPQPGVSDHTVAPPCPWHAEERHHR
jgi:hypothetical protein